MRGNRLAVAAIPQSFQPPLGEVASEQQDCANHERSPKQESECPGLQGEGEHRGDDDDRENCESKQVDAGERSGAAFHAAPVAAAASGFRSLPARAHAHLTTPRAMSPWAAM